MEAADYLHAVTAAQALLKTESPGLLVDGKWGDFTQSAYAKVSPGLKNKIDATVSVLTKGKGVKDLFAFRQKEKVFQRNLTPVGVSGDIGAAIRAAAVEFGINPDDLTKFAKIESNFNPRAVNGSSRGLMQMQPAAWSDASKVTGLRPYNEAVWDPVENARAGAAYIKFNERTLRKLGYSGPWDAAHMYLAHQQGAGGLMNMWAAANGKPSKLSADNMLKNPPQDGRGSTTNPKDFYNRWVAVVRNK